MAISRIALVDLVDWIDEQNMFYDKGELIESISWKLTTLIGSSDGTYTDPMPIEAPDFPALRRALGQD